MRTREVAARLLVLLVIVGLPAAVFGYQNLFRPRPDREFTIVGSHGLWSPAVLTVRQGEKVRIRLTSADNLYGFYLAEYGLLVNRVYPGKVEVLEFVADKQGTFPFFCTVPCGDNHPYMHGRLIVEPQERSELTPYVPSWPPPMARGRLWHTMTLLPDGRVLVTGGVGELESWDVLASTEVYNPSTQQWSKAASMGVGRFLHTDTLLRDGRVLVVGVYNPAFPTAEVYDPAADTWSSTGELAEPRRAHTATVLNDGKVLVVGGLDANYEFRSSAEIYDPATGKWSPTGSMSIGRVWHTTVLLKDGRVLVVGGCSAPTEPGVEHVLNTAEVYDPSTGQWSLTGSMEHERYSHKATLLDDGRVLVTGGVPYRKGNPPSFTSAEAYDPSTGAWSPVGSMVTGRAAHTTTVLPDRRILVTGGWGGEDGLSMTSAEVYDQSGNTWSPVSPMAQARQRHIAVVLPDGRVMVTGGTDKGDPLLDSVEVYDPATDTWRSSESMAKALASLTPTRPAVRGGETAGSVVTITQTEAPYTFQPRSYNFEVGKTYVLDFVPSPMYHTFTVWGLDLNIFIMPGERLQVEFTPSKVGSFRLICVAHEAMGMIGVVNVR